MNNDGCVQSKLLVWFVFAMSVGAWPGDRVCRDLGTVSECAALIAKVMAEIQEASFLINTGDLSAQLLAIKLPQLKRMQLHLETLEAEQAETAASKEVDDARRAANQLRGALLHGSKDSLQSARQNFEVESREAVVALTKAHVERDEADAAKGGDSM